MSTLQRENAVGKEPVPKSPWLDARKAWDSRWGELVDRATQWRTACFGSIALNVLLTIVIIILVSSARFKVWLVETDSVTGRKLASGLVDGAQPLTERQKIGAVSEWMSNVRLVTTDKHVAQRLAVAKVYAMVAEGKPAQTKLTEFYRESSPMDRQDTVEAAVTAVLAQSANVFEVDWTETQRGLQGETIRKARWKAMVTIAINPATDEQTARKNSLGIYVTDLTWAEIAEEH